jgi:hypothetical protein
MRIHIAGVNHYDPLGRFQLERWFITLSKNEQGSPAFIAVEWSEPIYRAIQRQSHKMRALAFEEWPGITHETVSILQLSLAYEASSHSTVFPRTPILWLDAGREAEIDQDDIENYVEARFRMYRAFLKNKTLERAGRGYLLERPFLTEISREAWARSDQNQAVDKQRDTKWADLILGGLSNPQMWAAAVVGANHAIRQAGSLRSILESYSVECYASILRPIKSD